MTIFFVRFSAFGVFIDFVLQISFFAVFLHWRGVSDSGRSRIISKGSALEVDPISPDMVSEKTNPLQRPTIVEIAGETKREPELSGLESHDASMITNSNSEGNLPFGQFQERNTFLH